MSKKCLAVVSLAVSIIASPSHAFDFKGVLEKTVEATKEVSGRAIEGVKKGVEAVNETSTKSTTLREFRSVEETPLYGLFNQHPWDENSSAYPRVALTIHKTPPFHKEPSPIGGLTPKKGCWTMSAVIWHNKSKRENVQKFDLCSTEDMLYGIAMSEYSFWTIGGYDPNTVLHNDFTKKRTQGPKIPEDPIPSDMKHKKFIQKSATAARSYNGYSLVSLFYKMGFDWEEKWDKRVWVVQYDQAYQ